MNNVLLNYTREQIEIKEKEFSDLDLRVQKLSARKDACEQFLDMLREQEKTLKAKEIVISSSFSGGSVRSQVVAILELAYDENPDGLMVKDIYSALRVKYGDSMPSYRGVEKIISSLLADGKVRQTNPEYSRNRRYSLITQAELDEQKKKREVETALDDLPF